MNRMSHIDWQDVRGGDRGAKPGRMGGGGVQDRKRREAGVLRRRTSFIKRLILSKK